MMNKVTINLRRTTVQRIGTECVNLYTGEVIDILADWPVELVRNITIEGDV